VEPTPATPADVIVITAHLAGLPVEELMGSGIGAAFTVATVTIRLWLVRHESRTRQPGDGVAESAHHDLVSRP
jgi:hypothetical protein